MASSAKMSVKNAETRGCAKWPQPPPIESTRRVLMAGDGQPETLQAEDLLLFPVFFTYYLQSKTPSAHCGMQISYHGEKDRAAPSSRFV